jgi:hypothetical protein
MKVVYNVRVNKGKLIEERVRSFQNDQQAVRFVRTIRAQIGMDEQLVGKPTIEEKKVS